MKYKVTYMLNYARTKKKYWEYKHESMIDAKDSENAHLIAKDVMNTMNKKNTKLKIDDYLIKEEA